jgi:hypothetical protein
VSAAEGLFHSTSVEVALRWPNDLYAAGRKLGGILCESSFLGSRCEFVVVGIGVNVNQSAADFSSEVSSRATSLRVLLGRFVDPTEVALAIAVSLERWWERESSRRVLERWRELASDPEGARVRVVSAEGNAYDASIVGLAEDGGLEVRLEDGARRVLHSDDVHLQEEDGSYYMEVEAHFVARRGSPLFITPSEWDLVWRWEQLGIPLSVVKEGIDRVFERPRALLKRRRLGYCRQTVEAAFRRFREARVGERYGAYEENASEGSGRARIEEIASRLRQVAADCSAPAVARAADEVESLSGRADGSPGEVEEALAAIDRELVRNCETLLDDAPREELRRDAERTLESYRERMPEKVYQAAVASAFRKRLRKKLGLPTLSLYA